MKSLVALSIALVIVSVAPCRADQTAESLSKSCALAISSMDRADPNYVENPYDTGFCVGYISAMSESGSVKTCVPNGVKISQTIKIFVKWTADHPEQLHTPAASAVVASMKNAFPCAR